MGAASAIAETVAVALAEAGADVGLTTAAPDAEAAFALRRITRQVEALGRTAIAESADMTIGTGVQVAVRHASKQLGGLDLLVVAPDLRLVKPAERLTDADWSRVLNTNLSAVFYACRSAARELQNNDPPGGRIVVLTTALDDPAPGEAAYFAAKAGVEALVRALAAEWRERGVIVNAVALPEADEETRAETAAAMVVWLAGEQDASLTGQLIIATPA
jgi:NAD(P)-dependent dehydrogenase (short-subunit alcohol dehydrogenase family)